MMRHVGFQFFFQKGFCFRWKVDCILPVQILTSGTTRVPRPFFRNEWLCLGEQNRHHCTYIYIYIYMYMYVYAYIPGRPGGPAHDGPGEATRAQPTRAGPRGPRGAHKGPGGPHERPARPWPTRAPPTRAGPQEPRGAHKGPGCLQGSAHEGPGGLTRARPTRARPTRAGPQGPRGPKIATSPHTIPFQTFMQLLDAL